MHVVLMVDWGVTIGQHLSCQIDCILYTWPVKSNENTSMTKITGVEMMITSDSVCLLLRCSDAHQWVYLRGHVTSMTLCMMVK